MLPQLQVTGESAKDRNVHTLEMTISNVSPRSRRGSNTLGPIVLANNQHRVCTLRGDSGCPLELVVYQYAANGLATVLALQPGMLR
jgi:hypothetical protein